MDTNSVLLLKKILSVPTKTGKEELMVKFITEWLLENNIDYYVDVHKNIYATKLDSHSDTNKDQIFPCVISHTDTVHGIDTINVVEEYKLNAQKQRKLALTAYNDLGRATGIGGDDKCGVFACLTLLKELPVLKAAFFVSEENGCNGSKFADPEFFKNVGYAIQFDAPENNLVTETCFGVKLFDRDSDFFKKCDNIIKENYVSDVKYMNHPYTDVYALKRVFDFSCLNLSIGYYDYHTSKEYVIIEDVFNGIKVGRNLIASLGCEKYKYEWTDKFQLGSGSLASIF